MRLKFLGCCRYFSWKICFSCSVQRARCSCSLCAAMGSSTSPLLFRKRMRLWRASSIMGGMTASMRILRSSSCQQSGEMSRVYCQEMGGSLSLSFSLSLCLSFSLSLFLSVFLCVCVCVSLSFSLSLCLSFSLSLSVCLSLSLSHNLPSFMHPLLFS